LDDRTRAALTHLFEPRHVAIVGASRTPGKIGNVVVRYLVGGGFRGRILPVNPGGGDIDGIACVRSIADLPEPADCAFLVVPASNAVEAVRACAARGVKSVIVGASGFAEAGTDEGRARQQEIVALARAANMRVLGPNTNGIYNKGAHLSLGYNSAHGYAMPLGAISIISHSGALMSGFARTITSFGAGLCKFVPVGNEADVYMLDVLEFCIEDDGTRVIGLAIEALGDGERFRQLATLAATRGKPVVALKIGRSDAGVGAALAHSSRLAGGARAYDALFDACGAASVRSVEGLAAACALLAKSRPVPRDLDTRLVCVTTSGAGGAMLADHAAERGMTLAGGPDGAWEGQAGAAIAALPSRGIIRNPIDTGSFAGDWSDLNGFLAPLEEDGLNGPTVAFAHIAPTPDMDRDLMDALVKRRHRTGAPGVIVAPGGLNPEIEQAYTTNDVMVFHETSLAFESLAAHFATLQPPAAWTDGSPVPAAARDAAAKLLAPEDGAAVLTEAASAAILRTAGVPLVTAHLATSRLDVEAAGDASGYPVVLKAMVPGVAHKNDMGFVALGLETRAELAHAFDAMRARVTAQNVDAAKVPFLVQPMLRSKLELIVGVSRQQRLGHFLLVGLGGIQAEALDETMLFPIALDPGDMRARIDASRVGRVLARLTPGRSALLDGLVAICVSLQDLVRAAGDAIESIDLNPVLVTDDNRLVAVDALIVRRSSQPA
jgi:acyl-CoA synthetase (NDP forming)